MFRRLIWRLGICAKWAFQGSIQGAASWTIIGIGLLGAALQSLGTRILFAEGWQGAVAAWMIYSSVAWLAIFTVRLFLAPFRVWREGKWQGDHFFYLSPKLVFSTRASPGDMVHHFRFSDAPPDAFINFRIELAGRRDLIEVRLGAPPKQVATIPDSADGAIRVNRRRDMYLGTRMRSDACPFLVQVYVTGWEA